MASENNATRTSTVYSSTSVNRALNFNRDYFRLRDYYETWSTDYDNDVSEENYCGPLVISDGYQQGRFIVDPALGANSEHAVHDIQKKTLAALGLLHTDHEASVCER